MKRHGRAIGYAALGFTCLLSVERGEASVTSQPEAQGPSTSVVTVQLGTRSASAPLEMRVSVQYVNSKAPDVIQVLAKAAGLSVEMPSTPLQPVTITLTNVRLRTALDAICDTASCTWRLDGTIIKVAAAGSLKTAPTLPATVSIELEQVPVPDVFRALGAAINVPLTIEGTVERPPMTVKFTNANTTMVLDFICKNAGCSWEFKGTALIVRFKAP
jgi:hypothetical protein